MPRAPTRGTALPRKRRPRRPLKRNSLRRLGNARDQQGSARPHRWSTSSDPPFSQIVGIVTEFRSQAAALVWEAAKELRPQRQVAICVSFLLVTQSFLSLDSGGREFKRLAHLLWLSRTLSISPPPDTSLHPLSHTAGLEFSSRGSETERGSQPPFGAAVAIGDARGAWRTNPIASLLRERTSESSDLLREMSSLAEELGRSVCGLWRAGGTVSRARVWVA